MEPFTGHSAGVATARPATAANTLHATHPQPLPQCESLVLSCLKAVGRENGVTNLDTGTQNDQIAN